MSGEPLDPKNLPDASAKPAPAPGLVLVFAAGRPAAVPIAFAGGEVELGRDHPAFAAHPDLRLSRRHARIRFDGRFHVTDLSSRNGTFADGAPLRPQTPQEVTRVVRAGDSLLVPVRDVEPFQQTRAGLTADDAEERAAPLRERPEEIVRILHAEVVRVGPELALHVSCVEACLLRSWPGDAPELAAEARRAAQVALATEGVRVEARHLSPTAGSAFATAAAAAREATTRPERLPLTVAMTPSRTRLTGALKRAAGNVSAAARELGIHRSHLRRLLKHHGLDPRAYSPDPGAAPPASESGEDE